MELRPYIKLGRKKARDVQGCARVPARGDGDLAHGVFDKFIKMDFSNVDPAKDSNLAETPPTFLATVYDRSGGKKVVAGKAEILLSSLCGYQNLNGEAILRRGFPTSDQIAAATNDDSNDSAEKSQQIFSDSVKIRGTARQPPEDVYNSCPVAAIDKVIQLLDYGMRRSESDHGGDKNYATGAGELRLRALYVPDKLSNAPGVKSAIMVRIE